VIVSAHKDDSWRMDETHVKVRGEWMYRYRAVDIAGETVDIFLSRHRDVNAAKAFLHKAMKGRRGTGQGNAGRVRGLPSGGS